jgi:hypothetical protein
MRAVKVKFSSPEADHSLRPPLAPPARSSLEGLFLADGGKGDIKVDAGDATCSMNQKAPTLRSQSLRSYTLV